MYRLIDDFENDWKYETESTLKLFEALTDEASSRKTTPDGRSLGYIAWHIVLTLGEMVGRTGLQVEAPPEHSPMPGSVSEITEAYKNAAHSVGKAVLENWNDKALGEEVEMYGEKWKRGYALSALVKHQAHHRGQMTILMRQAGLKVPGMYGPSKEEWAAYKLPPMD